MASDLEIRAGKAFIDDHFELAVDLYTQAIEINPNHAELYVERSQANIKLNNFTVVVMAVSVLSGCFWCGVPGSCGLVAERTRDKREGKIVSFRAGLCLLSWHRFEAVADANRAIELDPSMSKAFLRKGTACMKLEEYQTAKAAFEQGLPWHREIQDSLF
ncbi:Protein SGT1-like [Vitis vinifera]|uniref:Protein SGT1-like n=1 Tax=Vitis vinifera TaxID=29760 RepID=A0A438IZ11_VITVI|nr:Protein SGT1-like [Vitis vinifera]